MLSGGEQQRVAVARALVDAAVVAPGRRADRRPGRATADSLHELLREMHAAYGLTSVIATHNPRLAAACDRVLRLEGGRLIRRPALEAASHQSPAISPQTPDLDPYVLIRIVRGWGGNPNVGSHLSRDRRWVTISYAV